MYDNKNILMVLKTGTLKDKIFAAITLLAWLTMMATLLFRLPQQGIVIFYCMSIIYIISFFISPIYNYFNQRKSRNISMLETSLIITECILTFALITSLYLILMAKIYNLYYSYWVVIIGLILIPTLSDILDRIEKKDSGNHYVHGTDYRKIISIVMLAILYGIILLNTYSPASTISIKVQTRPKELVIKAMTSGSSGKFGVNKISEKHNIKIDDNELIAALFSEIESKPLNNIKNFDEYNFIRFKNHQDIYYSITTIYNTMRAVSDNNNQEVRRIISMDLFLDGTLIINEFKDTKWYKYPLKLSNNTSSRLIKMANGS